MSSKKVSFDSTSGKGVDFATRPPDVGLALGDVVEREFSGQTVPAAQPRRPRRALGKPNPLVGAATAPAASVSNVHCDPVNSAVAKDIAASGFPKAAKRQLYPSHPTIADNRLVSPVNATNHAEPHVDRSALYASALHGEGVTTLHPKSVPAPLQPPPSSSLSTATPLTLDLTEEDLTLAGFVAMSDDVPSVLHGLIRTGSAEAVSSALDSSAPPEYLPSVLRLVLKLLRSPVSAHNSTGVQLLTLLCSHEASARTALLWGGCSAKEKSDAVGKTIVESSNSFTLQDNYDRMHAILTESAQDPNVAFQAHLRFAALGTGGLLAQTTTPSVQEDPIRGHPNQLEWPRSAAKTAMDARSHQQLVYNFHKALSPSRFLDTLIHKNMREACGFKKPCPNFSSLSSLLVLFADGFGMRPNTWHDIVLSAARDSSPSSGLNPYLVAGFTCVSEPAVGRESSADGDGLDHDGIDELLAECKDGVRSKAMDSLGLVSVFFDHVLPLLVESGAEDIAADIASARRAAVSILWSLTGDPLVSAERVVLGRLLDTVSFKHGSSDSGAGHYARHCSNFISLIDSFLLNHIVLSSVDIAVDTSATIFEDISLVASLLSRICLSMTGAAMGASARNSSDVLPFTSVLSRVLSKVTDSATVLSAVLDGASQSDHRDMAHLSLLGLHQALLECILCSADMDDTVVTLEPKSAIWSWVHPLGESFLQTCGGAVSGHLVGVSANGAATRASTAAASLLIRPFFADSRSLIYDRRRDMPSASAPPPLSGARAEWTRQFMQLAHDCCLLKELASSVQRGFSDNSTVRVEASLAAATLAMALRYCSATGEVAMMQTESLRSLITDIFSEEGADVLSSTVSFVADGCLLPYIDVAPASDGSHEQQVSVGSAMESSAAALQYHIVSDWNLRGAASMARSSLEVDPTIVSSSRLMLLLEVISAGGPSSEGLRETLRDNGIRPMLVAKGCAKSLCLHLLTPFQIQALIAIFGVVFPAADMIEKHTPLARQFAVLLCTLMAHPEHSHLIPAEAVAGFALVAGSWAGKEANSFTGGDRLLFSLALSYLERHHTQQQPDGEEPDGEAVTTDASTKSLSNIFSFRDPPLEWFYSDGQVYREAALDLAEEDGDSNIVAGAVLEEERRVVFSRNFYNERQGFAAWLVWLTGIVVSSGSDSSDGSVARTLLNLDDLLIDVWLWRLRLASVGVNITPDEVFEYSGAVVPSAGASASTVAVLHTLHVGEACDGLLSALRDALLQPARASRFASNWTGALRSHSLRKIVESMPNISATLGFVPIPISVIGVAMSLLSESSPPSITNPGGDVAPEMATTDEQRKAQRLRGQVFLSLTRFLCLVDTQQELGAFQSPNHGSVSEAPQWMSWNPQQFTDAILAFGPSLKRHQLAGLPPCLQKVQEVLSSQLQCAVPLVHIHQQSHAVSRGFFRWGAESSEAVWDTIAELGLSSQFPAA